MSLVANVTGVILAGGKAERFGENKAFAAFRGVPFIERVVEIMRSTFEDLLIVTNTPQDYSHLGLPILTDVEPYKGPLGGIVTALGRSLNERIFVVACDMPILDANVVRSVVSASEGYDAVVPIHDGIREYLMALYSRRLLTRMRCCLSEEKLSLDEFCRKLSNVAWIPVDGDSWFNVNTRKDLEFLEKHHAH